jgi:hypothetical protein
MSLGTGDIIDDAMADAKLSLDSVYVVWSEQGSDILFKRNAISFDPSINLSNNAGKSSAANVAASENNVYVVWSDDTPGNFDILFRKSTDGGASFGGTVNLSNTTGNSDQPAVAAFGDIVYGQNVYVAWRDDTPGTGNSEILYRRSTDGGASFGGSVNLSNTTKNSSQPAVAASGPSVLYNNVYVVWSDDTLGGSDILYRTSTDGGASFGGTVHLMYTNRNWYTATVAASENNVYVVWNDDTPGTGNSEILYSKSTDGGASFGGTVNLSNTTENSYSPRVAASNNLGG